MLELTPGGNATLPKLVIKIWRTLNGSTLSLNLSVTTDKPNRETERKALTPGMPAKAFSTGMVTCCSTSVVLLPGH